MPRRKPHNTQAEKRRQKQWLAALLFLGMGIAPALASDGDAPGPIRAVIGVADPAHGGAAAFALSRAVMQQGGEAHRLEAPSLDQLYQAIDQARIRAGAEGNQLIIALSAGVSDTDGTVMLEGFGPDAAPLAAFLDRIVPLQADISTDLAHMVLPVDPGPGKGATEAGHLLLLETCGGESALDDTVTMPIRPGLVIGLMPGPGMDCGAADGAGPFGVLAELMAENEPLTGLDRIATLSWFHDAEMALADLLPLTGGVLAAADPPARDAKPIILGHAEAATMTGTGDVILLPSGGRGVMQAVNAGSGAAEPYRPGRRQVSATIRPASVPAAIPRPPRLGDSVEDVAGLGAMPTAAGMPEPSIVVGHLNAPGRDQATDLGLLSGNVSDTDAEARRRLRTEDPTLFARLLEDGQFDPEPDEIAAVIQTDLAQMGCYRGTVDGVWGNASRTAVTAYLNQAGGGAPVSQEADIALFRQIAGGADTRCTAPTPNAPPAVAGAGGGRATGRSGGAAARAPAQATDPNAGGVRGNLSNAIRGSGIIR